MDSLIEYRGYMLEDGTINRSANEYPDKIVIGISNFNFNESTKQLSIKYAIRCSLEETEMISLGYRAWFTISSDKFIKEFNERKDSNDVNFSEESSRLIASAIQISFSYVRQSLSALTNDVAGVINLPIIDAQELMKNNIEFSRIAK